MEYELTVRDHKHEYSDVQNWCVVMISLHETNTIETTILSGFCSEVKAEYAKGLAKIVIRQFQVVQDKIRA